MLSFLTIDDLNIVFSKCKLNDDDSDDVAISTIMNDAINETSDVCVYNRKNEMNEKNRNDGIGEEYDVPDSDVYDSVSFGDVYVLALEV